MHLCHEIMLVDLNNSSKSVIKEILMNLPVMSFKCELRITFGNGMSGDVCQG